MKSDIYIIGSSNTDMVIKSNSIPKPGETIIGGDFYSFQGGKGANQAVAASKLGGNITQTNIFFPSVVVTYLLSVLLNANVE